MKRIVAFDLDGTLLDGKNQIIGGQKTIDLLTRLQKQGVQLVVNSGRLDHDVYHIVKKYGLDVDYRISQNGAVIQTPESVRAQLLDKTQAKQFYHWLKGRPVRVELNTVSNRYWNSDRDPDFPREYYDSSRIVSDFDDIIEYQPAVLFLIIGQQAELEAIRAYVNENFPCLDATKTSNTSLEVLPKNVSKGNAIKAVFPDSIVYAIGDSENDFSMFHISRQAYYVGNGPCEYAKTMPSILQALEEIERSF